MEVDTLSADDVTNEERVSTLRGAGVSVDKRRLVWWVLLFVAVGLLVASIALFVAGARRNAQINELRQHGVPVAVTVSGCQGLLDGSGSNGAGYACKGTFSLDHVHYYETIPGDRLLSPGAKVSAVAVPHDSGLMTTTAVLSGEHASNGTYVLPSVLAVLAVVTVVTLVVVRRRTKPAETGSSGA
jgi:hypothetical protein